MNGSVRDLVLGYCVRPNVARLAPFLASLRRVAFAGDVCFFVEDATADTIEQLRASGVIVERAAWSAVSRMTSMANRYFAYLDFLTARSHEYGNVLLTDPADTFLQSHPFATPLPADIVFAAECRRIGDSEPLYEALVQAYGESVARNMRDCAASNGDVALGTRPGIMSYLAAMTRELGGRTTPITGMVDQAVHNYVVHMRPLRRGWLDVSGQVIAALATLPDSAIYVAEPGVLTSEHLAPVLSGYNTKTAVRAYVEAHSQQDVPGWQTLPSVSNNAVVAFYFRPRDSEWLELFAGSLRCVSSTVRLYCVGEFNQDEMAILERYRCTVYASPAAELHMEENVAHFYVSQVLDLIADQPGPPDQVLVIDTMRAAFVRDPFATETVGLSAFREGTMRVGESDYNLHRVSMFTSPDEELLRRPVVSSKVLRGRLDIIRAFYRRLFLEFVGKAELLRIEKVVQGAVNKLCHAGMLEFPVILHPSAAEVYFDFLSSDLAVNAKHGLHIGGAVPAVVVGGHLSSALMLKLRVEFGLPETREQ